MTHTAAPVAASLAAQVCHKVSGLTPHIATLQEAHQLGFHKVHAGIQLTLEHLNVPELSHAQGQVPAALLPHVWTFEHGILS